MKKIMYLLSIMVMVALLGCSSTPTLKMDNFVKAYSTAKISVDDAAKPLFMLINAKDGIGLKMIDKAVIYEYASKKELDKAKKDFPVMKDWPVNGLFVLESSSDRANEIFKSVQ